MWPIIELTLRKIQENTIYILLILGLVFCILADSATSFNEQIQSGSLLNYALGSQSLQIPELTSGTLCTLLFLSLITIFWGASEILNDIDNGTILILLAKPISRTTYVLGKYFGLLILAVLIFVNFEIALYISHFVFHTGPKIYTPMVFLRQLMPISILPVLLAITMFFSVVAGSMGSMIFTMVYLLFSMIISFLPLTLNLLPEGTIPGLGIIATILHYLFPNIFYFIQDSIFQPFLFCILVAYMIAVSGIFVLFMNILIQKKDIHS